MESLSFKFVRFFFLLLNVLLIAFYRLLPAPLGRARGLAGLRQQRQIRYDTISGIGVNALGTS